MSRQDFECHITVEAIAEQRERLEVIGRKAGWKTSFVVGDPDLGKGSRFFLTAHYPDIDSAKQATNAVAYLIEHWDIRVVRKKVELVVMDTKAGTWL